jgi:hypothetical protein
MLDNLVKARKLHRADPSAEEVSNLIRMGLAKLKDASHADISDYTKFEVAYNAAHALALAALWRAGYRSDSRYLVFQCTQHTLGLEPENWRVLDRAHHKRNLAEYEGDVDIEELLIEALIRVAEIIAERVQHPCDFGGD